MKNFSESCERNKEPILQVLKTELTDPATVLEIGSGSGQHALYFSAQLPHLSWQPSERHALAGDLQQNLAGSGPANLLSAISLDVDLLPWSSSQASAIFSANTLHIIPIDSVENFFRGAGQLLPQAGKLCVYGPFRYRNDFTSESNAQFDRWLKSRDKQSGIRDFELLDRFACRQGLQLKKDHQMPSSNQLLVWQKS